MNKSEYSQGIEGDSAVILRDGVPIATEDVIRLLNGEEIKKSYVVKPTQNNLGFHCDCFGNVYNFLDLESAREAFTFGRWSATRLEAEFAHKASKVRKQLADFIAELNKGETPDFSDETQRKFIIILEHKNKNAFAYGSQVVQYAPSDLAFFNPDHIEDVRANFSFEELEMALNVN